MKYKKETKVRDCKGKTIKKTVRICNEAERADCVALTGREGNHARKAKKRVDKRDSQSNEGQRERERDEMNSEELLVHLSD